MMERTHLAGLRATLVIAACLAGCGGPEPQRGNFKRAPDPVAPAQPAQAGPATQVGAAGTPAATGQATAPGTVQSSAAPAIAPALPAADSVRIEPVDASWSQEKKHEQTVARLRKIALAIREYAVREGRFPPAPGQKHSWRVLLLPYLGHAEQLAKFSLQEAWDSPANTAAAKDVPPVYQSPWRMDQLTCFLAPLGQNTVLASPVGVETARLNDKWSSIIELLMVEDLHAVPWSKPADFVLAASGDRPTGDLGRDRTGYLVALADGQVRWLPASVPGPSVRSLLTIGGDEFASASALTQDASAALPFFRIAATYDGKTEPLAGLDSKTPASIASAEAAVTAATNVLAPKRDDVRVPLPDEDEVEKARALLNQVFKEEIENTKKGDKTKSKHDLADELLKNASKVEGEPAAHFVLLQTARDSAAAVGDFKLAQQATTALIQGYQVDDLELRRRTVIESAKSLLPYYEQQNDDLRKESEEVLKLALEHDDFAAVKEVFAVYAEATRRAPANRQDLQRLLAIEKEIENFKRAYASVPPAIQTLRDSPEDADAHYTVGAYLCLAKFRWIDGAKHLVKGSNLRLKVLATEDQSPPAGPTGMVNLANEYWALGEQETGLFRRGLQLRAVYWYRQALPGLSAGLAKVQAERRSQEADKIYGATLVKEALAIMAPAGVQTVAQDLE